MARLVSRAELGRLAGVSGAAITKACKTRLAAACNGRRVDLDHPAVRKYLADKDVGRSASGRRMQARAPQPTAPRRKNTNIPAEPAETPGSNAQNAPPERTAQGVRVVSQVVEDVGSVADMTIREVIKRFGTVTAFKDWLTSLKAIEDIREKRLRNEEADGLVIPREPVKVHVFGAIDAANRRLLNDAPKTIARQVFALAKGGGPIEDAEQTVRDVIASHLKAVKVQASRALRHA